MSLLSAFKGLEDSAMEAKRNGQNSRGLTSGQDVDEVRPRKSRDGVDLISDRFRYAPIWYAGPDAVRNAVAYAQVPLPLALAPGNYPRVGRLCRRNPTAATASEADKPHAISPFKTGAIKALRSYNAALIAPTDYS
jgi:hypothetical protein